MFAATDVGMALVDENGRWIAVNPALCEMLGYTREELEGRSFSEFTHPEDRTHGEVEFDRLRRGVKDAAELEKRYIGSDGHVIWVSIRASGFDELADGRRYQIAQIQDVTRRTLAEEELVVERQLLNAFLRRTPLHVCFRDRNGRCLRMSDAQAAAVSLAGADEAIGKTDFDVLSADRAHRLYDEEQAIIVSGEAVVDREELFSFPAGHRAWMSTSIVPLRDHRDGTVMGTVTIGIDVTKRKLADGRLRDSEERWRSLLAQVEEMVVVVDSADRIVYASPAVERWVGYAPEEVVGRGIAFATHPDDAAALSRALREARPGHPICFARRVRSTDGSWRCLESRVVRLDESDDAALLVISLDVTERVELDRERERLEMDRRVSQRLEAVGQLAAGIAHEINTPLQFVGDSVTFLEQAVEDLLMLTGLYREGLFGPIDTPVEQRRAVMLKAEADVDVEYLIESIPKAFARTSDGIGRVRTIVQAMKRFSHASATEAAPADLNDALETTLAVCRNEYKYVAEVTTDLGDLPLVTCNVGEINQLFLNLVINAAQAIDEKVRDSGEMGHISLSTRVQDADVVIVIADDGPGIPDEIRERIYEPFFTTKEVGKGTGQGLALARTTIERHNGSLRCTSVLGEGTTFTIRLPVSESQPQSMGSSRD